MTSSRDDDALGWAGDDDPTLVSGRPTSPAVGSAPAAAGADVSSDTVPEADLPEGWAVTGSPGGYVDAPDEGKAPLSSPALVAWASLAASTCSTRSAGSSASGG